MGLMTAEEAEDIDNQTSQDYRQVISDNANKEQIRVVEPKLVCQDNREKPAPKEEVKPLEPIDDMPDFMKGVE